MLDRRAQTAAKDANGDPDPSAVLGGAEGHLVLYAETDIEEGTLTAAMIGASAPAGDVAFRLRPVAQLSAGLGLRL